MTGRAGGTGPGWRQRLQIASAVVAAGLLVALTGLTAAADPTTDPTADPSRDPAAGSGTQVTTSSTAVAEPLVIVLDLSTSMEEDDGSGTVKLDGAKSALIDVVRGQPTGSAVGLWTYPAEDGDCSPGSYVPGAELRTVADPSTLAATIRNLDAYGNTPTGDALRAVTDDLISRNHTSASLLLVSDGESNCGQPPCEVAQQIVDEGFDITVQAMGFQISDGGRKELECIALATNGRYYDVADSTQLAAVLDEISVPTLSLDVTAVKTVPGGSATTITAVVSNPSAQAVADASVSLSFADAGSRTLFPAVVPPRYRLGNLPPGTTATRSWTLSTAGGQTGVASWRVSAWTPDVGATSATGEIEVTDSALGLSQAGTLLTEAITAGPVVILGDSYSSGEGSGDYLSAPSKAEEGCHRSNNTYGVALFGASSTTIVACSGAVTGDLLTPNHARGVEAQLRQVQGLEAPGLVVLTFGGNDMGFGSIVMKCVLPGDCSADTAFVAQTFAAIDSLQVSLESSYRAIHGVVNSATQVADRSGAAAPIVVLAYPQVLPDWRRGLCAGFTPQETAFANDVVARLDAVIARSVSTMAEEGVPAYFAGHVQDAVLPDHTACSKDPFINDVTLAGGTAGLVSGSYVELLHPNTSGYQAMANSLVAWSQTSGAVPRGTVVPGTEPITVGESAPSATVRLSAGSATNKAVRIEAGGAVTIVMDGLAPGTTVTVSVRSSPRAIASWVADEAGTVEAVAYIPPDLTAGSHTLVASGLGPDMTLLTHEQPLTVVQHRPWWFWPAAGLSAALVLGAGSLLALRRRGVRTVSAEEK